MTEWADGVWTTDRPQRFYGVETGTRMTVLRLSDGGLFVHGPVRLDAPTRAAVEALGPVRAIACASLFHHLYAGDWITAWPDAVLAGCPGLAAKRPDLPWSHTLGDEPHPAWAADLSQVYLSARFEHEVVFHHARTRTLLCHDALLNLRTHPAPMTRFVSYLMLNDAPGTGWMERIAVGNRANARAEARRVLEWDFDRVILAHGANVERDGRAAFRRAYGWLGDLG